VRWGFVETCAAAIGPDRLIQINHKGDENPSPRDEEAKKESVMKRREMNVEVEQ
jgi:hypothetical protein